jgi:hypothetical protein
MAYPLNTAHILEAAGYDPLHDFEARSDNGSLTITWHHADPQPTEQQVIDWGNDTALPDGDTYTSKTTVPDEVTNYQLKQALNTMPADRAAVDALVAASGDQNTIDGWNNALVFKRTNPLFQAAIVNLGWTQQKVNDYLKLAATFD